MSSSPDSSDIRKLTDRELAIVFGGGMVSASAHFPTRISAYSDETIVLGTRNGYPVHPMVITCVMEDTKTYDQDPLFVTNICNSEEETQEMDSAMNSGQFPLLHWEPVNEAARVLLEKKRASVT